MTKQLWLLVVCVAVSASCCATQSPVWTRAEDGRLRVTVPGVTGAVSVTVTVYTEDGQDEKVVAISQSSDKWRAVFDNTPKTEALQYAIEYLFPDSSVHRVTGSHTLHSAAETGVTLGSERYLRRRATTVFYEDFSSGQIRPNKWKHDIMTVGIGHFQMWTPEHENSYVKNGMLFIRPTFTVDHFGSDRFNHGTIDARQIWGDCRPVWGDDSCVTHGQENRPFMSALLRSEQSIRYGRVEVQAKLPRGDWLKPAIWMMPEEDHYGGWPKSGEIDIMESTGNLHLRHPNGLSVGLDCDFSTIHYGNGRDGDAHARQGGQYRIQGTNFGDDFHTYWLDWTEQHIRIGVDGHTVLAVNTPQEGFWNQANLHGTNIWASGGRNAPFDRRFHLILDVAVGGLFFWDGFINSPYPKPWTTGASNDHRQLWNARHLWEPTWHGEDVAMRVRSVKMQQY